nr:hypothetical protein BaRGS_014980 [Batillaria attramentaria]
MDGLETLHSLTSSGNWTLRIDLGDWEGNTAYATYTGFYITNSTDNYRLMFDDGSYSGDAGDDLSVHNGMGFSTYDKDITDFCAAAWHGAWWFNDCYDSHLNGEYKPSSSTSSWEGIIWYSWKGKNYSLKFIEMKIKRL